MANDYSIDVDQSQVLSGDNLTGNSGQKINKHKLLTIKMGGVAWPTVLANLLGGSNANPDDFFAPGIENVLALDEDVSFAAESEYKAALADLLDDLKKSTPGKAFNAMRKASAIVQGVSSSMNEGTAAPTDGDRRSAIANMAIMPPNVRYQTSMTNLKAWESVKPLQIFSSVTFKFYMGIAGAWDGRTEVYNPVIALSTVNLPEKRDPSGIALQGPLPSVPYVYGQLAGTAAKIARDAASSAFASGSQDDNSQYAFESAINDAMGQMERDMFSMMSGWRGMINLQVGNRIKLPTFTVKKTNVTFSRDTDDKGYPIWGEVTWDGIESVELPYTNMETFRLKRESD